MDDKDLLKEHADIMYSLNASYTSRIFIGKSIGGKVVSRAITEMKTIAKAC